MSRWYKVARRFYLSGQWDDAMLRNVLEAGRITQDEYDEIVAAKSSGE